MRPTTSWLPPDTFWYKINFDGVLFHTNNLDGIGVVIRNATGLVMASLSQQIPLRHTILKVEALVARQALEFALEILTSALRSNCNSLAQFCYIAKVCNTLPLFS